MQRSHFFVSLVISVGAVGAAFAQSAPPTSVPAAPSACTRDYLAQLEDDLQANREMRSWTTDYLRPVCRAFNRAEELAPKIPGFDNVSAIWDKAFPGVDGKSASRMCRYARKMGEDFLTPEEGEKKIRAEIERCKPVIEATRK